MRIDKGVTTTVPIPKLDEAVSTDTLLSDKSYLIIQNNSSYSFQLHVGTSVISPDDMTVPVVNSGERAQYTIYPSAASPYQLLVGADYKAFSGSTVNFEAGHIYCFVFDGAVSLTTEIEIKLDNVTGSSTNSSIPGVPEAPTVTASDGMLTMRWIAVEKAEKYEVYISDAQQPPAFPIKMVTGTTTVMTDLANKTAYYVWIKAANSSGSSDYSPYSRGIPWPDNLEPAVPGIPVIIPGISQLTVNWEECGGAVSYEVYINTSATKPSAPEITTDKTSAVIKNLENDKIYYIWVRAVNGTGKSDYSPVETGTPTIPTRVPAVPGMPTLAAGSRKLSVSWQAVEFTAAYEVWYGTSNNSAQAQKYNEDIENSVTNTVISGLVNETTYYVWVKAKNIVGASGFSPAANAKPSAFAVLPEIPGLPTVTPGTRSLSVSWTPVEGALSYEVWTATTNNVADAKKYGADVTGASVTLTGLTNDTTYYIWIKAKNNIGASELSPRASGTPSAFAAVPPAPLAAPTVIAGSGQLTASWPTAEGANSYEVWAGTDTNPTIATKRGDDVTGLSSVITGLNNGTTYYIWIKAKNAVGTGDFSPMATGTPSSFTVTPQAPSAPTISTGNGQITVTWAAVAGTLAYEVWMGVTNSSASAAKNGADVTASLSATVGNLTNGTTYYVWIKAKNNIGTSGFSPAASGKPIANATAPTVSAGNGQLSATWAAVAGADQYEVFCGTGTIPPQTASQTVTATTATISGLVNGTTYNVWVRGKNATGTGATSPAAGGKPIGNMGPVTLVSGSWQMTASWSAVAGADQYEVYCDTTNSIPESSPLTVSTTTATITGLTNGTAYNVWVKPKNANGEGSASAAASGTPLATPGVLTVDALNQQIALNWTAVPGAGSYEIYQSTTTTIPTAATFTAVTEPSKTVTGLTNGTTYNFWVKAVNANGTSGASPMASGKPIGNMGTVTVGIGNEQVSLSWSAVAGADQYEVYQNSTNSIPASPTQTITANTVAISGLTNNTTYYFWVKPKNANGAGTVSAAASGKPVANIGAVTLVSASGQLTASWAAVVGADQYEVYRNTSNSIPASASQTVSTTTATMTGLTNGTTYYVWVKPKNATGTGGASTVVSGKPIANMGTVTLVSGNEQLTASWSSVAGADQYEVYYSTSSTMPGSPTQTVSTTTATISSLTNGTTYYVWVRGKNANGTGGASTSVSGRPIDNMGTVTLVSANSQLTASWSAVAGASSYEVYYSATTTIPADAAYTGTGTSRTITGLTNGTTYYFWVKAVNANGTSGASPMASAKPVGNMGTVTVTTGGSGELVFTWSAVAGADQYEVYYDTTITMPVNPAQTINTPTTTATITGLTNGTTYYVSVRPKNANGTSGASPMTSGKPIGTPAAPTVTPVYKQLLVTWTAVAGADQYEVYYGTDSTPTTLVTTIAGTTTSIGGVDVGTTYYVRLRAKNANGISDYGPSASGVPNTVVPAPGLYRGAIRIGNQNLADSLTYISSNAVAGDDFYIVLGANESSSGNNLSRSNVGITLLGYGAERTITLNAMGVLFNIYSNLTLTLDKNITLIGMSSGNSNPLVKVTGKLIMNDGAKITGNSGSSCGGVSVSDGNFTMNGGTISGNTSGNMGGGVNVESGIFTMNGGEISGNKSQSDGGGVYVRNNGSFTMSGGAISSNTASAFSSSTYNGGGVSVSGSFTMSGGAISGNTTSGRDGGGVDVSGGNFTMSGGEISSNTSLLYGGGVYVSDGTFTMNGGTISGNTTKNGGGGVSVSGGTFTMNGGTISGNTVGSYSVGGGGGGGGVWVYNGTFTKTGGGTITGYDSDTVNGNVVKDSSGVVQNNRGHAVYWINLFTRDTTLGAGDNINLTSLDNGWANAATLTANSWTNGNIASSGASQWFKFTATANTQYLHVSFGTLTNLYFQVYDSSFNAVGTSSNLYSSTKAISRTVTSGQEYYVRVLPYGSSGSYSSGTYQIAFTISPYPPGTTIIPLAVNTWADGNITSSGASQWFKFTATANTQYLHVSFGTLTDLYFQVYDSSFNAVGTSSNLYSSTKYISRTVTSGQEYYVRVGTLSLSSSGTYQIAFNTSDTPPFLAPTNATTLTANTWADGNIATSSGEQWFKFTATASTQYIHVSFGTLTDLYVNVYTLSGTVVGSQANLFSSTKYSSRTVTSGQEYYIKITPYSSSGRGTYQIAFNTSDTPP